MKGILLSGIQPTGNIHIGNYLGFLKSFVNLQADARFSKRILSIADLHSISTGYRDPIQLKKDIRQTLALILAAGVDPKKTILIQQSRLTELAQLMWILGASTTLPKLTGIGQFKDKSKTYKKESVPIGLVTYPLLQVADILAFKSTHVLVGSDQQQHLEIVREVANLFNKKMKSDIFPLPEWIYSANPKIKSLKDPSKKMSKSDLQEKSRINMTDSNDIVTAKVKGMLSDFDSKITYEPEQRPAMSNMIDLYCSFTEQSPDHVVEENRTLDKLAFKLKLASIINDQLDPIREKYQTLVSDERLLDTLREGEELARPMVRRTLDEIKIAVGFE